MAAEGDSADWWPRASEAAPPPRLGLDKPHISRVYDYLLGGKDHFAADRAVGDQIIEHEPDVYLGVREQRALLGRVVRYMVAEAGIRQLIDIGTGLPTADNVHEIAHRVAPEAQVVYVDNDPVVLAHARAMLESDKTVGVVEGDIAFPKAILADPQTQRLIDFTRPVGLILCGILHHIPDSADPWAIVRTLRAALPSGSYVFLHHLCDTGDPEIAPLQETLRANMGRGQFRTGAEIAALLDGLELLDPGLVPPTEWRPATDTPSIADHPVLRLALAGVGRKP